MADDRFTGDEAAILDDRTRDLARPATAAERRDTLPAVGITVVGERYAIEASAVHGVATLERLTRLPHAPDEVAGLVVRAGAVLPVFHLRAVLELPLRALPERAQVLFLGAATPELGLVVDQVGNIRRVDLAALSPPPPGLSSVARDLLHGFDHDGVPVLDGEALLRSERLTVDIPIAEILRTRGTSQ